MIFNKNIMGSLITGFKTLKEVCLAGLYTKLKYLSWRAILWNKILLQWKKKENLKELFFFTEKKDKDEFNTILKHLIKLVKNFKTHCYVFFSFLTFSNISHLATFFFFFLLFTCTSGAGTKGWLGGVTGVGEEGVVFTDLVSRRS